LSIFRPLVRCGSVAVAAGIVCALLVAREAGAGIVPPRQGGPLPKQYIEAKRRSPGSFTLRHGWIAKRERQVRGEAVAGGPQAASALGETVLKSPARALHGHFAVPVVMGLYSNIAQAPITSTQLQTELFNGPWPTGTLRGFYKEVSFNLFDVDGTVFDWVALAHPEDYYTGGIYQGLSTDVSKTGDMIKEIVDALDPTVNFGQFDNDGPDGIPNSGDDDGYVDVLLVIHPTWGAECDNTLHMWSHSFAYSGWPVSGGLPYSTNDPAANGGTIKIDDYILAPALSCDKTSINEIGVVCHEFGHVLGLPDLYDYDGDSAGIGYWGLMGAGNWNSPESPAHFEAWSLEQLGWLNPVEIDYHARQVALPAVGSSADVLKMILPTVRFRRQVYVPNNHALLCSYSAQEAAVREWPGGEGYGNDWDETLAHDFSVTASRPVTLSYDVSIDVEHNYDWGKLLLDVGGAVETLAVYTGTGSKHEVIDLGAHLPVGACDFTLRFLFLSDYSVSDEDGGYDSRAGYTYTIDNVRLTGGGADYFADFELDSGGWRNESPPAEYFLVENRRKFGFDKNLPGEGLLIWHVENSIAYSVLGNSGGTRNTGARGLVLEEADGQYNLISPTYLGGNFGDSGDPYPGASGNTAFGSATVPRSQTNGGVATPVFITGIATNGALTTGFFKGGLPAPTITTVLPDTIDKETAAEAVLDVRGDGMLYGATAFLSLAGDTVRAARVDWLGPERIIATIPIERLYAGRWDVTVVSGDGQTGTAAGAVTVLSVFESASVTAGRSFFLVRWTLRDRPGIRGSVVYRASNGGSFAAVSDTLRGTGLISYEDSAVVPGVAYSYRIVVFMNGGSQDIFMLMGPFSIENLPFHVDQNFPNPFRSSTTLSFFVPVAETVAIDIFDVAGRLVDRFPVQLYQRGDHRVVWDAATRGVQSGIYFCRMKAGGSSGVAKLVYFR
jgi:M6 family metalloprotease-like protein